MMGHGEGFLKFFDDLLFYLGDLKMKIHRLGVVVFFTATVILSFVFGIFYAQRNLNVEIQHAELDRLALTLYIIERVDENRVEEIPHLLLASTNYSLDIMMEGAWVDENSSFRCELLNKLRTYRNKIKANVQNEFAELSKVEGIVAIEKKRDNFINTILPLSCNSTDNSKGTQFKKQ